MSDVIEQVAVGVLQDFADAWNRHDVDALMTFMADDCVFEASAGPDVAALVMSAARRCELVSLESGWPFPMLIGVMHAISCADREASPNGRSLEHARTARASKFMVAICLCSEVARLR